MERGKLVHRGLRAVVVDRDLVEHTRVRTAGTDDSELLLGVLDGLFHLLLCFEERVINHYSAPLCSRCLSELSRPGPHLPSPPVFGLAALAWRVRAGDERADLIA